MTFTVWGTLALSFIAVILGPLFVLIFRLTIGATRLSDRVVNIEQDLKDLVSEKDKTHQLLLSQMKDDRQATDRRLRWLEQNLWRYFRNGNANPPPRYPDSD